MSITIRSTFGEPAGGSGRDASRHSLNRSAPQREAAMKGTAAATRGKLPRTSRRTPVARRSRTGTRRIATPRATTNEATG